MYGLHWWVLIPVILVCMAGATVLACLVLSVIPDDDDEPGWPE